MMAMATFTVLLADGAAREFRGNENWACETVRRRASEALGVQVVQVVDEKIDVRPCNTPRVWRRAAAQ